MSNNKISKRFLKGQVVSDKMTKTIIVRVDSYQQHPKYKKRFKVTNKYFAHDPQNQAHIGDLVQIVEHRPLSHNKRWLLKAVLKTATLATIDAVSTSESDK